MNTTPLSARRLIFSSLASLLFAILFFIFAVLPAEFNIDPTGLGKKLGLTALAKTAPARAHAKITPILNKQSAAWQDIVLITIPAQTGLEYKFKLNKDENLHFSWQTQDRQTLYFDFHGDPEGDTSGYFKRYKEQTASQLQGDLIAPFTGKHGWYWKNNSQNAITIILKSSGNYDIIGLL